MPPKRKRTEKTETKEEDKGKSVSDDKHQEKAIEDMEVGDASDLEEEQRVDERAPNRLDVDRLVYTKLTKPGWADTYKPDSTIAAKWYKKKQQQKNTQRHATEKAGHRSLKIVPPMHPQWPVGEFNKNTSLDLFLHKMVNNPVILEIMQWETDFEVGMKQQIIDDKTTSPHFSAKLQWKSWSAMLQLELTYPTIMESCKGWDTCFEMLWEILLQNPNTNDKFKLVTRNILTNLNKIIQVQWAHSGVVEPVSVRTFIRDKILSKLKKNKIYKDASTESDWNKLVATGPLQVPDDVAARLRFKGEDVVTKALQQPQQIHESSITEGVKKLVQTIWGDEMDTTKEVDFGDEGLSKLTVKLEAACLLVEIMCGSRMIGILLFNWFEKVETATMEEWEKEKLPTTFGSWSRCIKVTRLSKEGTKVARKEKARKKGVVVDDIDIVDRVIVKPLNIMFLDRQFLAPAQQFKTNVVTDDKAVDIFLYLVTQIRKYVLKPARTRQKGLISTTHTNGIMGVIDEQVEYLPPPARKWVNNIEQNLTKYAREVWPGMFRPRQGTHLLRKIYMIWSYSAFASNSMKETGYASLVLGHRGFKVSLNYTSLLLTKSVAGEVKTTKDIESQLESIYRTLDDMKEKVNELENTKKQWQEKVLTEKPDQTTETKETAFVNNKGRVIILEKLQRAEKGTSIEKHMERALKVVDLLMDNDIAPSWKNLRKMGVNNTDQTRESTKMYTMKIYEDKSKTQ